MKFFAYGLVLLLFLAGCTSSKIIKEKVCEEENPEFNAYAACEHLTNEKYAGCHFKMGLREDLPLGSCTECLVTCFSGRALE